MWRVIVVSVASLLLFSLPAKAYCMKPSAPYCTNQYGRFNDRYEFDRCKIEMNDYAESLKRFQSCIINDAENEISSATGDYNDAVEGFNRRVNAY
ncbi:MAG: hypothetical protein AB7E29_01245 [Xanthobacter sp.]